MMTADGLVIGYKLLRIVSIINCGGTQMRLILIFTQGIFQGMESIETHSEAFRFRNSVSGGTLVKALRNAMVTLLVLNVLAQFLPPAPQWITDNGNKYIVMRSIAKTGSPVIRHAAPEFFPTGGFHFVRHRGKIRSFYPEYYPALAAKYWKLAGDRGLVWLSMLGTALTVGLLTLMMGERRAAAPFLLAFATPMCFFSFLLWEMTWSVFAMLAAWISVQKKRYLVAGAVLGAALLLREEAYFFAFALTVALACRRDFKGAVNFLFGMAALTLPIWLYQYLEFGHIFGFHGGNYYANNRVATGFSLIAELKGAAWNYYHHLFRFGRTAVWNWLCLIPAMLAVVLGAFTSRRFGKLKLAVGGVAVAGWSVLVLGYLLRTPDEEAFTSAMITGAIGSNPLFLPFYLNWRRAWQSRSTAIRDAAVTVCVYLLFVPPFMTRNDIGLIYGARHFLCIMPLLLFSSCHLLHRKFLPGGKIRYWLPAAAAAVAVLLQAGSFFALRNVAAEAAEFERTIGALPEKTVVTDIFFIPEQTPHLFFDKDILKLDNVPALLEYLRRSGRRDFILLLSADPRFRRIDNGQLALLLNAAGPISPPGRFRKTPGSGIMDIHIVRCRLK